MQNLKESLISKDNLHKFRTKRNTFYLVLPYSSFFGLFRTIKEWESRKLWWNGSQMWLLMGKDILDMRNKLLREDNDYSIAVIQSKQTYFGVYDEVKKALDKCEDFEDLEKLLDNCKVFMNEEEEDRILIKFIEKYENN